MITVEYAEGVRFFPLRVILRIASIASMFYTSKELDDPPNGRFWTLTPDGDVYPETLSVPSATGLVWTDGRRHLFVTTMMLAGHFRCEFMDLELKCQFSLLKPLCGQFSWILSRRYRARSIRRRSCPRAQHLRQSPSLRQVAGSHQNSIAAFPREMYRRAARRRPEEMTEPCGKEVGVLLAEAVHKVERPVSHELLPLPIGKAGRTLACVA